MESQPVTVFTPEGEFKSPIEIHQLRVKLQWDSIMTSINEIVIKGSGSLQLKHIFPENMKLIEGIGLFDIKFLPEERVRLGFKPVNQGLMLAEKRFIGADQLRSLSFKLGEKIMASGFRPKFLIALWRGGAPIGLYIHEYLAYFGLEVDHISIRTSNPLYREGSPTKEVSVHGEQYVIDQYTKDGGLGSEHPILLIDDILESGRSMRAVLNMLEKKLGPRIPQEIRIACVFTKSGKHQEGNPFTDFSIEDCPRDQWIVFPHELKGLSLVELKSFVTDDVYRLIEAK
jgi:uncharacterized protein